MEEHQSSREESQNTTEEALSANEELQSLNEELETAKEELQSTNEELITVNDELQAKNAALAQARDFAMSIVETVRQPLLVLDTDLRVRMANRAFYRVFQVSPLEPRASSSFAVARQLGLSGLRDALDGLLQGGVSFPGFRDRAGLSRRGAKEPGDGGLPDQSSQDDSAGGGRHHRAQTGPAGPAQRVKSISANRRRWRPSAGSLAASLTTSTTCSRPLSATAACCWMGWPGTKPLSSMCMKSRVPENGPHR